MALAWMDIVVGQFWISSEALEERAIVHTYTDRKVDECQVKY